MKRMTHLILLALVVSLNLFNLGCGSNTSSEALNTLQTGGQLRLASIEIYPTNPNVPKGTSVELRATALVSDGSRFDVTRQCQWLSLAPEKVSVDNTGRALALDDNGAARIQATFQGVSANIQITLSSATLQELKIDPQAISLPKGTIRQIEALGTFSDGNQRPLASDVVWNSADTSVATVIGGKIVAVAPGSTTISVSFQGFSAQATLSVTQASLLSLELSPSSVTTMKGSNVDITSTGIYTDGSRIDLTEQCSWSSLNSAVAAVSDLPGSKGRTFAASVGQTQILVTLGNLSAECSYSISPASLVSLAIRPTEPTLPLGSSRQFSAEGTFSDGTVEDLTKQVTWNSSDRNILTISNADLSQGLARGLSLGNCSVTATLRGISQTQDIGVSPAILVSLAISPAKAKLTQGKALQFVAQGLYSDGSVQDLTTQVNWSTTDSATASISASGQVTGLLIGKISVRASLAGVQSETALEITNTGFRDKLWVGGYGSTSGFASDLFIFEATTLELENSTGIKVLPPDAFSAYDADNNRVYLVSSQGLNVLDASTGKHLLGSPYHAGTTQAGTKIFSSVLRQLGFRAFEVAYDANHKRIYLATLHGLYAFSAIDMSILPGSPFAASGLERAVYGLSYDSKRNRLYLLSSESDTRSGDNNVIAVFDGDTLSPIAGSPFIPPGNQTLMYGQLALDTERGKLYSTSANYFTEFDVETRVFTVRERQGITGGSLTQGGQIYVPELDLLAMVDFNQRQLEIYDGSTLLPVSGSPVALTNIPRSVTYDPYSGRFLVSTTNGIEVIDATTRVQLPGLSLNTSLPGFFGAYFIVKVP